ncbi:hypothetical protein C2845_PM06G02040 [Panicum miliaceum]|uniref:Uncharacterized protein n=1 Tax=Panicum miliaceum TaxID=4540 RepID=A0A3L6R6S7_PANMI|nr:hypothetical protein C2845_PM06G02040 [Panicum miliaceum]
MDRAPTDRGKLEAALGGAVTGHRPGDPKLQKAAWSTDGIPATAIAAALKLPTRRSGPGSWHQNSDESVTKRLHRMNQRLRQLEQQMETLEADVAKASGDSEILEGRS